MAVLALDLGTHCGFAIEDGGQLRSGTWNLKPDARSAHRTRELNLWMRLVDAHHDHHIELVAFERVEAHGRPGDGKRVTCPTCESRFEVMQPGTNIYAAHVYGSLKGVVDMWCDANKVRSSSVHVMTLKKFATGSGRATKKDMIARAEMRWKDQRIRDDNQADALHVLDWALVEVMGKRTKQVLDLRKQGD